MTKLIICDFSETQPEQDLLSEEDEEGSLRSHLRRASCSHELPLVERLADEIQGRSMIQLFKKIIFAPIKFYPLDITHSPGALYACQKR